MSKFLTVDKNLIDQSISYYFGIGPIEEIVRNRREKFVNGYVASVNCLCRLLYRRC